MFMRRGGNTVNNIFNPLYLGLEDSNTDICNIPAAAVAGDLLTVLTVGGDDAPFGTTVDINGVPMLAAGVRTYNGTGANDVGMQLRIKILTADDVAHGEVDVNVGLASTMMITVATAHRIPAGYSVGVYGNLTSLGSTSAISETLDYSSYPGPALYFVAAAVGYNPTASPDLDYTGFDGYFLQAALRTTTHARLEYQWQYRDNGEAAPNGTVTTADGGVNAFLGSLVTFNKA